MAPVKIINEPCPDNDYLGTQAELILSSLFRLTGRHLVDPALIGPSRYRQLFEAPFCVVSHNTDADPIFNYGNRTALTRFEMTWEEFTRLPSRLSAEPGVQEERDRLLDRVTRYGYIDDYRGVRVSSTGRRFRVEDAVVWNLIDEDGVYRGQAAVLFRWTEL
jgi:hypothetical protein